MCAEQQRSLQFTQGPRGYKIGNWSAIPLMAGEFEGTQRGKLEKPVELEEREFRRYTGAITTQSLGIRAVCF
jgi:hypothetical protein